MTACTEDLLQHACCNDCHEFCSPLAYVTSNIVHHELRLQKPSSYHFLNYFIHAVFVSSSRPESALLIILPSSNPAGKNRTLAGKLIRPPYRMIVILRGSSRYLWASVVGNALGTVPCSSDWRILPWNGHSYKFIEPPTNSSSSTEMATWGFTLQRDMKEGDNKCIMRGLGLRPLYGAGLCSSMIVTCLMRARWDAECSIATKVAQSLDPMFEGLSERP
jgi:hypothetical protein